MPSTPSREQDAMLGRYTVTYLYAYRIIHHGSRSTCAAAELSASRNEEKYRTYADLDGRYISANLGVSRTFLSGRIGQHLSDASRDLANPDL